MSNAAAVASSLRWRSAGFALVLLVGFEAYAQEGKQAELPYFEHERTVELSDEKALIGLVRSFDVSSEGAFLLDDPRSDVVWIFGPEGKLRHELSPDVCRPGPNPGVSGAYFVDDEVLLLSSRRRAYRFDRNGACMGEPVDDFDNPKNITFDAQGNIYGFYVPRPGAEDIVKMNRRGEKVLSFGIDTSAFPMATVYMNDGGLTYYDGHIYHVKIEGPEIYKYTTEGERVDILGHVPGYFRPMDEDYSRRSGSTPGFTTFGQFYERYTIPIGLHLLDDSLLLVVHRDSEAGGGMQVYHSDGRLVAEAQDLPVYIQHARDGRVYTLRFPDARDDGTVPNPSVEIFRYVGPNANDR